MSESKLTETKPKSSTQLMQADGGVFMSFSIRYSDLTFDKSQPLGEGAYGKVYKGEHDFNTVAIKEYTAQDFTEKTQREIRKEASVMAQVSTQSDYLVRLKGMSLEKPHYCLVMEYMPGGDLYHLLHGEQDIPWDTRYRIGMDISIGLHHLHTREILHCDLKSLNVLLDSNGRAKLADFGMATIKASSATSTKGFKGTILWAAPETFMDEPTKKSDVYSAGMILWELASREIPYKKARNMASEWIKGGKKETVPTDTPAEFKTVILNCWQAPDKRPTASDLAKQLDRLWKAAQQDKKADKVPFKPTHAEKIRVSQEPVKLKEEKKNPHPMAGKKLGDGSQMVAIQPVAQSTLDSRIGVQLGSSLYTNATTAALLNQSSPTTTTSSVHASSSAFFSDSSSSSSTSAETKTKAPMVLDEKQRKQLMPLQNELIKASENGSLEKVKVAIAKGALVDLPNEQGKNPLYCAVYGMNPDVVQYLIKQRDEGASVTSWSACEEHNKKQYGQTFLIMKFDPVYYKDWYELLLRIEPNEFLAGYHLARCQKVWGVGDKDCASLVALREFVTDWMVRPVGHRNPMRWVMNRVQLQMTEKGYEGHRNQIKQAVEGLQVAQTKQSSMNVGRGTN